MWWIMYSRESRKTTRWALGGNIGTQGKAPLIVAITFFWVAFTWAGQKPATTSPGGNDFPGEAITAEGYLRDTECLLKNPKAGEANTPETKACMRACYKGGSPLGILTRSGELYTLLGGETPDSKLRAKLAPLLGRYVKVIGTRVRRGGSQAIVIKSIAATK